MANTRPYIFFCYDGLPLVGPSIFEGIVAAASETDALTRSAHAARASFMGGDTPVFVKCVPVNPPPAGAAGAYEIDYSAPICAVVGLDDVLERLPSHVGLVPDRQ
jgi:hypothetical protein